MLGYNQLSTSPFTDNTLNEYYSIFLAVNFPAVTLFFV